MTDDLPAPPKPRVPPQAEPYVAALGEELAAEFLLQFGGAPIVFSAKSYGHSRAHELIGEDGVRALGAYYGGERHRVPLEKKWLAQWLAWKGQTVYEIARRLHVTDITVRKYLTPRPSRADDPQLPLFDGLKR